MSTPTRPLVTIDDPVTIIEPHRVLLEWVDQVHRDGFYVRSLTSGSHITIGTLEKERIRHDQEGTTWARGHHLPDSEVVVALRAAASLVPHDSTVAPKMAAPPPRSLPPLPSMYEKLIKEAERGVEEYERRVEREAARPRWWKTMWGNL